jgi:hypothetical protein
MVQADDAIEPNKGFTDNLKRFSDMIHVQGLRQGYWLTVTGGEWGRGRDAANPKEVAFKLGQMRKLIAENRCAWTQVDLGLTWMTPKAADYCHPEDSVYRKVLGMRRYMNTIAHESPQFLVHTTCEVDNPAGQQCVGLLHVPDNGIAGMFRRTDDHHYLKDLFNCIGSIPLEACLEDWGGDGQRDGWQETPEWYYQFFLVRHVSVYIHPGRWSPESVARMRKFNDWRRLARIESLTRQMALPVYNGSDGNNAGPWAWLHSDNARRSALLFAVGAAPSKAASFRAPIRWLDPKLDYAVVDLSMEKDADGAGTFRTDWIGKVAGADLATTGLEIDFSKRSCRAACLGLVAIDGTLPQVVAADDAVAAWEAVAGSPGRLAVRGRSGAKGRLLVYRAQTGEVRTVEVALDAGGRATMEIAK